MGGLFLFKDNMMTADGSEFAILCEFEPLPQNICEFGMDMRVWARFGSSAPEICEFEICEFEHFPKIIYANVLAKLA